MSRMRDRLLTRGIYLAVGIAIGLVIGGIAFAGESHAHPGGLARDGCHKDNAAGNRHWHDPDTRQIAGLCDENGPIIKTDVETLSDLVNELMMKVEALEAEGNFTVQDAAICEALSTEYEACYNDHWCSEETLDATRSRWIGTCARAPPDE